MTPASAHPLQQRFLREMRDAGDLASLFDFLPATYFYVKNTQSQFTMGNRAFLDLLGVDQVEDVLGKTDRDYFVRPIADKYIDEDQAVMSGRRPISNQVWLVPDSHGALAWYVSTKTPLFDRDGEVIGIAGVMRDYERAGAVLNPYTEMSEVVEHITAHFARRIDVKRLAAMVHLSVSQFDRKFKQIFGLTPLQYITRIRVDAACDQLVRTEQPLSQIAQATGFYDHSYFTKQFKKLIGMTPKQYRKRYQEQGTQARRH
jgi:PAS domain S-box-containing protein